MQHAPIILCACALALALPAGAQAQQATNSPDKPPQQNKTTAEPPAPIIITRPGGQVSVDPGNTDAIQDRIGRDPDPGASEAIHCRGGQTISEAEGNVRNATCE